MTDERSASTDLFKELAERSGIAAVDTKWAFYPEGYGERLPAARLVELLKTERVIDATCDGEGHEDVRLLLDNGLVVMINADLALDDHSQNTARAIGRPVPFPRLVVSVRPRSELWPFDQDRGQ